jgi:hypothetical protein
VVTRGSWCPFCQGELRIGLHLVLTALEGKELPPLPGLSPPVSPSSGATAGGLHPDEIENLLASYGVHCLTSPPPPPELAAFSECDPFCLHLPSASSSAGLLSVRRSVADARGPGGGVSKAMVLTCDALPAAFPRCLR